MFKIIHNLCYYPDIYHPYVTIFTRELLMHSNLNCLLLILMHIIFHVFLTQCQFGILWLANVLALLLTVHLLIILEVKIFLAFTILFTIVGYTLD